MYQKASPRNSANRPWKRPSALLKSLLLFSAVMPIFCLNSLLYQHCLPAPGRPLAKNHPHGEPTAGTLLIRNSAGALYAICPRVMQSAKTLIRPRRRQAPHQHPWPARTEANQYRHTAAITGFLRAISMPEHPGCTHARNAYQAAPDEQDMRKQRSEWRNAGTRAGLPENRAPGRLARRSVMRNGRLENNDRQRWTPLPGRRMRSGRSHAPDAHAAAPGMHMPGPS